MSGKKAEITIVGCCDLRFFTALSTVVNERTKRGQVVIRHYMEVHGTALINTLYAIQPLLYDACYDAYIPEKDRLSEQASQLYTENSILASWVDMEEQTHYLQMQWTDQNKLHIMEYQEELAYWFHYNCLHQHDDAMKPLKRMFPTACEPQDYLAYTEAYFQLENKRELYDIKQDVPINYIHPDLLVRSVVDGFRDTGFADEENLIPLVGRLYQVHLKRYNNFVKKHKVTHTIFSADAMRKFAVTGKTSDHFFAMRPYTRKERVAILQDLYQQTRTNPYFTVYFFRSEIEAVPQEFCLYDGIGVLMTKAYTDYHLDGEHSETLICQPEFCRRYKEYFMHNLLVNAVTTPSETLKILDELIILAAGE